jgi:ribosome biogenesis GTPase
VRSCGIAHIDLSPKINSIPDQAPGTAQFPPGCTPSQAECALDAWVEDGHAGPAGRSRLDSLRRVLRARNE